MIGARGIARIALRNCFRHKTRSLITISAIAFGCVAIIFVGGFFEDLFFKMRESYIKGHTGHIQIYRRGYVEHGSAKPFDYLIEQPEAVLPLIRQMPGVVSVSRRLEFAGLISTGDTTVSCIGQGVEPAYEPSIRASEVSDRKQDLPSMGGSVIETGEPLDDRDRFGAVLGRGLASGMDAKIGDGVILVAHTVGGSINALDVTVRGLFFTSAKAFDDRALRLPLETAQELLQTQDVQALVVMLARTDQTAQVRSELERLFAERKLDLELRSWDELSDFYLKTRHLFGRMFFVLKLVIAIIVVLGIYNTMNMAVLERTNEIGTIMALGTKRRGVWTLFLFEGAALGVMGGLLGLTLGTLITLIVHAVGIPMPPPPGATMTWISEPIVVPSVLAYAFFLGLVTAILSACYPAYKASRLEIADALRHV